jgi:hypothetical protein
VQSAWYVSLFYLKNHIVVITWVASVLFSYMDTLREYGENFVNEYFFFSFVS